MKNIKALKDFMMANWDERYIRYKKGCPTCEAWKCYYFLIGDPDFILEWGNSSLSWFVNRKKWKEVRQ